MATNWPPTNPYPTWPPEEFGVSWLSFSDIQTAFRWILTEGWSWENPTSQENNAYFKQVKCDEGHPCSGIMIITPLGIRYPFAYCTGAIHKSALVLWVIGYTEQGDPCYDLGWDSGAIA